jgi:hypothetical protein
VNEKKKLAWWYVFSLARFHELILQSCTCKWKLLVFMIQLHLFVNVFNTSVRMETWELVFEPINQQPMSQQHKDFKADRDFSQFIRSLCCYLRLLPAFNYFQKTQDKSRQVVTVGFMSFAFNAVFFFLELSALLRAVDDNQT